MTSQPLDVKIKANAPTTKTPAEPSSSTTDSHLSTAEALIRIEHVSKQFIINGEEIHALKDVNCYIRSDALNIITGPSGSGKSTLLDTIVGLQPPTSGHIFVGNQDIYELGIDERAYYRARMLGMVYQANYWVRSLNVIENVAMPLYLSGYDRAYARMLAELSLDMVEMLKYAEYQPTLLSGGQQQRVSMARAIVGNPEVIVADEPTGNLDTRNGSLIMDLLINTVKQQHKTVVLVTHNLEYLPLGNKNLFIKDGVLTEGLSNEQILASISSGPAKEVVVAA